MNPYASYLGDREPVSVISATAQRLGEIAKLLGKDGLEQSPAPGKWSAREILCHLADCEIAFAFRIRQCLAEENHTAQPFDQDAWAKEYGPLDGMQALAVFTALRGWNVALVKNTSPQQRAKKMRHPERGEHTFQTLIETMGGHDVNHLQQLERIAARAHA